MRVEELPGVGVGKWIVPCISRRARPEGVWRRGGRGFSGGEDEEGFTYSGIEGIVLVESSGCDHCVD